jgi:hypothetical protein
MASDDCPYPASRFDTNITALLEPLDLIGGYSYATGADIERCNLLIFNKPVDMDAAAPPTLGKFSYGKWFKGCHSPSCISLALFGSSQTVVSSISLALIA